MTLSFSYTHISHLVKALSAAYALQQYDGDKEPLVITDDHTPLLTIACANAYMNVCGLLIQYLDDLDVENIESGELTIKFRKGIIKVNPLVMHSAIERYVASCILDSFYTAVDATKASALQLSANERRNLLALLAL